MVRRRGRGPLPPPARAASDGTGAVGGDTIRANAAKADEELSPPLRDLCDGLSALHDAGPHLRPEQTHIHPVGRVHPETGRRSLFVNEHFTCDAEVTRSMHAMVQMAHGSSGRTAYNVV